MGQVAHEHLGRAFYGVGFTAHSGRRGVPMNQKTWPLEPPAADSLEALFHAAGRPYAFVDFRELPSDHWLRQPRTSCPFGYVPAISNWTENFDAMFFTDVMFPCTPAGDVPEGVITKKR